MATTVLHCSPTKVTHFGRYVLVEFGSRDEALELEQAFLTARRTPEEHRAVYAKENGIDETRTLTATD